MQSALLRDMDGRAELPNFIDVPQGWLEVRGTSVKEGAALSRVAGDYSTPRRGARPVLTEV
jgi:uncharacterized protein YbdZ (MbtH family)